MKLKSRDRYVFFFNLYGEQALPSLKELFLVVEKRYLKKVFRNKLSLYEFHKLFYIIRYKKSDESPPEPNFPRLMRDFKVFGQIIVAFAEPSVAIWLQQSLAFYRIRLSIKAITNTFESVKNFHNAFVQSCIYASPQIPNI